MAILRATIAGLRYNSAVRPFLTIALLLAASLSAQAVCACDASCQTNATISLAQLLAKGVLSGDLLQAEVLVISASGSTRMPWGHAITSGSGQYSVTGNCNHCNANLTNPAVSNPDAQLWPVRGP